MREKQHVFYMLLTLVFMCAGCQQSKPVSQADPGPREKATDAAQNAGYIDHYFYFPERADADTAFRRLQERGWTVEPVKMGADERNWLVRARQPGPIEDLGELEDELDRFATDLHGEYDGWEAAVSHDPDNKQQSKSK